MGMTLPKLNAVNLMRALSLFLSEFGPFVFAVSIFSFLESSLSQALLLIFKSVILFLSMQILYGWVYIANEVVTKYEPIELRTERFNKTVTMTDAVVTFVTKILVSQIIILLGAEVGIFSWQEYFWVAIVGAVLISLMIIHQVISWETRSLVSLPLLRITRIVYVFLPLINLPSEQYWMFVYAFAIAFPHALDYFGDKLIRITVKSRQETVRSLTKLHQISTQLVYMIVVLSTFSAFSFLLFANCLEALKLLVLPTSVMAYLVVYAIGIFFQHRISVENDE